MFYVSIYILLWSDILSTWPVLWINSNIIASLHVQYHYPISDRTSLSSLHLWSCVCILVKVCELVLSRDYSLLTFLIPWKILSELNITRQTVAVTNVWKFHREICCVALLCSSVCPCLCPFPFNVHLPNMQSSWSHYKTEPMRWMTTRQHSELVMKSVGVLLIFSLIKQLLFCFIKGWKMFLIVHQSQIWSSNVLFCPQHKYIQFTVVRVGKKPGNIYI